MVSYDRENKWWVSLNYKEINEIKLGPFEDVPVILDSWTEGLCENILLSYDKPFETVIMLDEHKIIPTGSIAESIHVQRSLGTGIETVKDKFSPLRARPEPMLLFEYVHGSWTTKKGKK